ncbi:MFS transporter [soil metagenome]
MAQIPVEAGGAVRRVAVGGITWGKTFAAFRHRNYRLFFCGQLVSLVGTWLQMVAEGWLVYDLSNSEFTLGLIRFLHTLPFTILTLVGGALADRLDKRSVLIATQSAAMLLAIVLASLVAFGAVAIWHVAVIGFLLGTANAVDVPVRQSLVVDLVGKRDLMNGIALNSSMFNAARVVGPALAGVLIGTVGVAGCFALNAASFVAVLASYFLIRLPKKVAVPQRQSLRQATGEAFRHVGRDPVLRSLVGLITVFSLFGWSYVVLMPVFARDVLGVGAGGFGLLMAANGAGAFCGAMALATLGDRFDRRRLVFLGAFGLAAMLMVFTLSRNVWLSGSCLVLAGFFMIIFFATANTTVQLRSPDALRGRIMGIYMLAFVGLSPFGSLIAGALARATNAPVTVAAGAAICALAAALTQRTAPPYQPYPSSTPESSSPLP